MGKKILALFLASILCLQMISVCAFAAEDAGSPKHIPRIVSIVFDDSGSMYNNSDRWAYTSYAMQAFAAMMGKDDVLYITYLNAPAGTVKVDLSDGAKNATVSGFANIMFGGGTPNKVQKGADCLTKEYAKHKTNAKYYLVVMADGELDSGLGKLSDKIAAAASSTKAALAGADFETVYFSMKSGDNSNIPGVTSYFAASSNQIVNTLKTVSADIMGRTAVDHSVSGGTLSFNLKYPVLSIAVFAQKKDGDFQNFRASVKKDGKTPACQVGNYSVKCPTTIIKNTNATQHKEVIPSEPPAGVVSLITNNGNPLEKGTYSIDISGYDLQKDDIVVLVEPAVRIGCKYRLNDDDTEITFEELKKRVAEGDTVTVSCGLYEMNPDGSMGDAVPLDILSPDYKILINGKQVGTNTPDGKHSYSFKVDKSFENQQMKVEARLEGYQPFVLKESFGKLNIHIQPLPTPGDTGEIALTKPLWEKWSAGEEGISFQLKKVDASVMEHTAISVEGCNGLPAGICTALGNAVRADGNTIVYLPTSQTSFEDIPETFQVSLVDLQTGKPVVTKNIKVVRPTYRIEISNPLADTALTLEHLKNNTAAVTFTLKADYSGTGQYIPISESNCEESFRLSLDAGILPGKTSEDNGTLSFVPRYDPNVDTQLSIGELVGKNHSLFVTAEVNGQTIQSDKVTLSFSSAAYRLEVENEITAALSLDTIKTNQQKVIFRLLADYDGSGTFGELAQWDTAALDRLIINAGKFPGKAETVYDAGGKPVGKAFTPQYDENNNGGIPFTAVAGRTHEIVATLSGTDLRSAATVEVLAPDYDLIVRKEGITLTDVKLRGNTESVAFTVMRDGRALTRQELENLPAYELGFDKNQPWIDIHSKVCVAEDGTAYLECTPEYTGWRILNWLCLFTVKKGDMHLTMTLGEDVAAAAVKIETSKLAWIILLIVLGVILLILWIIFCCATRIRFLRGVFYVASFQQPNSLGYTISSRTPYNANKKSLTRYLLSGKFLIPFCEQHTSHTVGGKKAVFTSQKSPYQTFNFRSFPYSIGKTNKTDFNKGHLTRASVRAIVNKDKTFVFESGLLTGSPCTDNDVNMNFGSYLVKKGGNTIIFFLTKSEEKDLKERRAGRARQENRNTRSQNAVKTKIKHKRK